MLTLTFVTSFYHFREKLSVCWRFSAFRHVLEGFSGKVIINWVQYNDTHGLITQFLVGWDREETRCYNCILVFSPLASKFRKKKKKKISIWRNTSQSYTRTVDKGWCITGKVWSSKMSAALPLLFWIFVQLLSDSYSCQSRRTKPFTNQPLT